MLSDMILTGYIGRLSVTEISALGIAGRIYSIYFAIFKGFAIGMMVVFAKSIGNGRSKKEVCLLYKQALLFLLPCAVISALLIWVFPEMFLSSDDSVSVPETNDKNARWFYTFCRTQLNSDSYRYDWYIGSQSVFMLFSK